MEIQRQGISTIFQMIIETFTAYQKTQQPQVLCETNYHISEYTFILALHIGLGLSGLNVQLGFRQSKSTHSKQPT